MRRRPALAGDLLDVAAIEHDGLLIRQDGTHVRAIEVSPINPLVMEDDKARELNEALAGVAARLESGQSLQLYAHAEPLPVDDILRAEAGKVLAAQARCASPDRALALNRLGSCEAHSIRAHSRDLAAVSMRYVVLCPWRPPGRRHRGGQLQIAADAHHANALASLEHADGIRVDLEACELRTASLTGPRLAELIGARTAGGRPVFPTLAAVGPVDDARSPLDADAVARHLREVLMPCDVDLSDPSCLTVGDSTERVLYVSGTPDATWLGWLLLMMQRPRPFSISVFWHATDRVRERLRHKRRAAQITGVNDGQRDRGKRPSAEARQQEEEAEAINEELARQAGAGIYRVSVYASLRAPADERDALDHDVKALQRELLTSADARTQPGRGAQCQLWLSSLPIGLDVQPKQRSRKHVTRTAMDTTPLVGTRCGSPASSTSVPLGYSHPGRSLESLDLFDREFENHIMLVNGRAGTGKTTIANLLRSRWAAHGATGFAIDRGGHFSFAAGLDPDARSVTPGSDEREAICPWDVSDPSSVPREKLQFLLGFHELIVGGKHGLDEFEVALLDVAIRDVYKRCATTSERPRELILQEELTRARNDERDGGDSTAATRLHLLARRLDPFVGDGTYAYLTDWPTSVPDNASFVVFDTRRIPESYSAAAMLAICGYVSDTIERRREHHLAGRTDSAGGWSGKAYLILDELWKLMSRETTGAWVQEFARRSRHLALAVVAISQQLEDFDNPHGRALLKNATVKAFLRQEPAELEFIKRAAELSTTEVETIRNLRTAKRQYSTVFLMNGSRGRGKLSVRMSAPEYWIVTNDPSRDEPLRRLALRQASDELQRDDHLAYWRALELLCDPEWHARHEPAADGAA